MKGDGPGGKHDTGRSLRDGDQLVKVSGVDEIAMRALRHREEREAESHQKRLREIKNLVRKLQRYCWPRQDELLWPDENDLERLHLLVLALSRRIRKQPLLPRWKRYKAVDGHWHLGLWQTLSDLVDRAASNAPRRPLEDYAQALTSESLGEATKRFFRYYSEVIADRLDPSQIKWEQFDELFSNVTSKTISRSIPLLSNLSSVLRPRVIAKVTTLLLFGASQAGNAVRMR